MHDQDESQQPLIAELAELRRRVAELEGADAEHQRLEKDLDLTFRLSPTPMCVVGMDGYIKRSNAAFEQTYGRQDAELLGRPHLEFFHPDDAAASGAFISQLLKGEPVVNIETRICRPDGSIRQLLWTGIPLAEAGGIVCIGQDVTDHKRTEAELKKAHDELERRVEERTAELSTAIEQLHIFHMFMEASGQGFGMADFDGRITYWNPTLCRFFGEDKPEDVAGKHVSAYYPQDYWDKRQNEILPTLQRGETWQGELLVYSRQGKATPILQNTFLIRDEKGIPVRLAAAITDITERKRAEEALRQSHDELRAIYESLGDGLLVADRETLRLVRANAAICSMLGYSEEELLSMSIPALHPREFLSNIVGPLQADVQGHLPCKGDVPMLRKDGGIIYADITGDTFTYQGRPCSLGVFRDVTERRQAQEALERERRTLEHMLQASDHERQLIAYDIHDGLAQELAGAIMQFQIYEQQKDARPQDAQKAFDGGVALLRQGHFEARRLISGVRPPILDESGVMAAISHLVHDPAFEQGPKIDFRSRVTFSRLAPVLENVIYRIVQEGLSNARNHSKSKKIVVSLVQRGERLRIEVRDWGVGFDPKNVQENRFGLDGIRERARLLGGKCTIHSKPGDGTAVVVELPVAEQPREE